MCSTAKITKPLVFVFSTLVLNLLLFCVLAAPPPRPPRPPPPTPPTLSPALHAASGGNSDVSYQRYTRRRPPTYPSDLYMDEFLEVFSVRRQPPAVHDYRRLSDDEVDRIIRCDFDPSLEECKLKREHPSTAGFTSPKPATTDSHITTTDTNYKDVTAITTTTIATTTTTSTSSTPSTTIPSITEDLPFLPDIPASVETSSRVDSEFDGRDASTAAPHAGDKDHVAGDGKAAGGEDYEDEVYDEEI